MNRILNITGTGAFIELVVANGFPQRTFVISLQARTAADMTYHWRGQTEYWTVKSGTARTIEGVFWPGDLFVNAANGVVMEIECSTDPRPR